MRGVVVAVEQYEVSTFCAKKCFFSKVQIHKNHNSLKKYHSSRMKMNGILLLRNYIKFPLVKVIVSNIAYENL